jgi:hypothetical protein
LPLTAADASAPPFALASAPAAPVPAALAAGSFIPAEPVAIVVVAGMLCALSSFVVDVAEPGGNGGGASSARFSYDPQPSATLAIAVTMNTRRKP